MLDSAERKRERLESGLPDTLSENTYNLILGGCVLYGLLVNVFIVTNFSKYLLDVNPVILILIYLFCCFTGIFITRSDNPIASFIGYNFVVIPVGTLLAVCLPAYAFEDVQLAIGITTIIVAIMVGLATVFPKLFAGLGRVLFITLSLSILAESISLLFGYTPSALNWLGVILFTLYIGYDWYKAQMYPKTIDNAIDSALDIYLDIINLFLKLLRSQSKRKK